jgi:hypothetical protein
VVFFPVDAAPVTFGVDLERRDLCALANDLGEAAAVTLAAGAVRRAAAEQLRVGEMKRAQAERGQRWPLGGRLSVDRLAGLLAEEDSARSAPAVSAGGRVNPGRRGRQTESEPLRLSFLRAVGLLELVECREQRREVADVRAAGDPEVEEQLRHVSEAQPRRLLT